MQKLEFRAMGTQILAVVDHDSQDAASALQQVPRWFEEWEQMLSRFRADSELSRLNRSQGRPFQASPLLWEMLQLALDAHKLSGGLVSPAVLPALERAGYRQSFELIGAGLMEQPPEEAEPTDLSAIQLDEGSRSITLPPGMRLDFGGVAKGWAAHEAMLRLRPLGPSLVDAGGDIAVSVPEGEDPWPIEINDPWIAVQTLPPLVLANGGVATSGVDKRRWQQDGVWQHHIIDPRSGQPADTDVMSATVIAPTLMQAEMASKSMLILGSDAGLDWLERTGYGVGMVILNTSDIVYGNHFEDHLRQPND